jgi:hypothetical protein
VLGFVPPLLPTPVDAPPAGTGWLHKISTMAAARSSSRGQARAFTGRDDAWSGQDGKVLSDRRLTLIEVRISPGHSWHSRIRPDVYRPFDLVIPGATDAADEMIGYLRHRQPLPQIETTGIDVEMAWRPANAAVHLEQLSLTD